MPDKWQLPLGANYQGKGVTQFRVFAPLLDKLILEIEGKTYPLQQNKGYHTLTLEKTHPGMRYSYLFPDGRKRPDPVSRSLPEGVTGRTEIIDPRAYRWHDGDWKGVEISEAIFYEIHVGTFSKEGTFAEVIAKLDYLKSLGINVLEIMPIAEFLGRWNWGYDGVSLYAPYSGYGGVEGFKKLIDAAHQKGIAICLDVVYNHLGPEGNILEEFAPYFDHEGTPWGSGWQFEGEVAEQVREYLVNNALYWVEEYHVDMLRLDAMQYIPHKMVQEIARKLPGRVMGESDTNDVTLLEEGLTCLWNDDYHHAVHVAFTGEQEKYYQDFQGCPDIAYAVEKGFVYDGTRYAKSRKTHYGTTSRSVEYQQFVAYVQNHDQIGNRPKGERLISLVTSEKVRVAAFLALFSPFVPMLFMGEEYGERAPFAYFTDLGKEKSAGEAAFLSSKLHWEEKDASLFALYQKLIFLRKSYGPAPRLTLGEVKAYAAEDFVAWEYPSREGSWVGLYSSLGDKSPPLPFQKVQQRKILLATEEIKLSALPSHPCSFLMI